MFTADRVLESEQVTPEDSFRYKGAAVLRQWLMRWSGRENRPHAATFLRHHLAPRRSS